MSYFNSLTLTTKGQEMLLSSNMNIDKIITFTNASLGNEKLLPEEIKGATEIKNSWLKFPLNTVRIINDESNYFLRTEIAFTNAGIIENKIMRELGIYAKFENEEEVLFAYSTTNDDGETIPKEDIVPATYKFTIDTTISTETKINQILSPEGFLTKEVIELLKENIRNIAFRKIQGALTANQKVIQVPTDILLPISQRAILNIEGEIYFLGRDYTIDIHANTITLNGRYNFKEGTQYEIIDPLPATYVKEQIQEFIDDFKKLVSDSKIDFDKLKDKIYLEFQEKVDSFYLELNEFVEQNKENLKGHSIDRIVENGKDESGGNIYNIFRDDNKNIGTIVAPRGLRGNGIATPNYKGKNENGDTLYSWILEDGVETTETTIMPKGENGKSFYIAKIYPSIIEMRADFETDNIDFGEFVLISSEDSDNGKLFEKTTEEFKFIVNMGGVNNTLKPATANELGGVRIGDGITVDKTGTISVIFPQIEEYNLPIATKYILGGVKIGEGVNIDESGAISISSYLQTDIKKSKIVLNDVTKEEFDNIGSFSTLIGVNTGRGSGTYNVAIGFESLKSLTSGNGNVAIGSQALFSVNRGNENVAIGNKALYNQDFKSSNVAVGTNALMYCGGQENTAMGSDAGKNNISFNNTTCIGFSSNVSGNAQVQLGNSSTTTYCYGSVQNRSDERDKTDIKDSSLGLDFLRKLRPREYRWDYRESYINTNELSKELENVENENVSSEEKKLKKENIFLKYSIENVKKDGSKKGWRFHQGFIAQEVFQTMRELGVDFGGFQDHSINGGKDVLSIGYNEFIPVLVKGIQEQQEQIKELSTQLQALKKRLEELNG